MNDTIQQELQKLNNLSTGDEIHFTNGTIWCCNYLLWTKEIKNDTPIVLVPCSFKDLENIMDGQKIIFGQKI